MKLKDFFRVSFDTEELPKEFVLERYRNWRAEELKATDWTQLPDAPVDVEIWKTYRQTLRDLPAKKNFVDLELPTRPIQANGRLLK